MFKLGRIASRHKYVIFKPMLIFFNFKKKQSQSKRTQIKVERREGRKKEIEKHGKIEFM